VPLLNGRLDQTVAGKTTPGLELWTEIVLRADHGYEIAWACKTQCGNEFNEQAGRKCLRVGVEFDIRS
jgi:hypothetical protein